jgi:hypothetical protein
VLTDCCNFGHCHDEFVASDRVGDGRHEATTNAHLDASDVLRP